MKKEITIFVSYSRKDYNMVSNLIEGIKPFLELYFKEINIKFWRDQNEIYPNGESIKNKIVDVIREEIDFGLLLYSENFLTSEFIRDIEYPEFYKKNNIIRAYLYYLFDDFKEYDNYLHPQSEYIFELEKKGFVECRGHLKKREYCQKLAEKIKLIIDNKYIKSNYNSVYSYKKRQQEANTKLIEELSVKINFSSQKAKELLEKCLECEKEEHRNQLNKILGSQK